MKHLLQTLALWLLAGHLHAQVPPLERIGIEQGLSQGFVTCLLQDREGFVWMGTFNGLNRYDGQRFKLFTHDPFNEFSLPGNYITTLYDRGDYLLIGTQSNGLCLFHKKTQRFFRLPYAVTGAETQRAGEGPVFLDKTPHSGINYILEDGDGNIWLRTHWFLSDATWFCRMALPTGFWEKLSAEQGPELFKELLPQVKFECWNKPLDSFERLADGKTCYSIQGGKLLVWDGQGWEQRPLPFKVFAKFNPFPDRSVSGDLWATIEETSSERVVYQAAADGHWKEIFRAPVQETFFGMNGQMVWRKVKNQLQAFPMRPSPFHIDLSAPLWTIGAVDESRHIWLSDRSNNLWYAESVNGLIKFSPQAGRIRHYLAGRSYSGNPVATPSGNYFSYTPDQGLTFARKPGDQEIFLRKAFDYKDLWGAFVHPDRHGQYWMLSFQKNASTQAILIRADPVRKTSKRYDLPFNLRRNNQFQFDEDGSLWFAASGQLVRFDPATETWASFDFRHLGMNDLQFSSVAKTADGSWWLATDEGMVRAKPSARKQGTVGGTSSLSFDFEVLRTKPKDRNSLSSNVIACLVTDQKDAHLLWICTKGGGLNSLDVRTGKFTHLTTKQGLPNDVIYGLLPDGQGHLWLSSNRGLIRYNPATGEIKSVRKTDGLQDDEFNSYSFGQGFGGELMFGGVNGLNVFNPQSLTDNPVQPKVFITGLKINNLAVEANDSSGILGEAIEFAKHIVLPYSKNSVTLEFAALEYTAPSKNRYRYWLEGLEDELDAHEDQEPHATYLGLPPGRYTFIVYGSNNDGVWSDEPARLEIRILPPWYRSWWAWLCYLLALFGATSWYWHLHENRRQLRHDLELEQKEAMHRQELHRMHIEEITRHLEMERLETAHMQEVHRLRLEEITQRLLEKSQLIEGLADQNPEGEKASLQKRHLYNLSILTRADWMDFQKRFEQVYPGFIEQLSERVPSMTPAEARLLLLTKMGLNTLKTAAMLGVSPDSVKKTRYRLRKKMESHQVSIEELLDELDLNN